MSATRNRTHDSFTFSLGGATKLNSFGFVPVVSDNALSHTDDERRSSVNQGASAKILVLENFLARYYAPRCCQAG